MALNVNRQCSTGTLTVSNTAGMLSEHCVTSSSCCLESMLRLLRLGSGPQLAQD